MSVVQWGFFGLRVVSEVVHETWIVWVDFRFQLAKADFRDKGLIIVAGVPYEVAMGVIGTRGVVIRDVGSPQPQAYECRVDGR